MKRIITIFLIFSLLLSLTACGETSAAAASPSPSKTPAELLLEAVGDALGEEMSEVDVETDVTWTEINENDGTYAYMLTGDADLSALGLSADSPLLYSNWKERVMDTMLLQKLYIDGTVIEEYTIPMLRDEEGTTCYCFGDERVWLVRNYYGWKETEEYVGQYIDHQALECWDSSNTQLFSIAFDELFGADSEFAPYDMTMYGNTLLLMGESALYWIDETGSILDMTTLEPGGNSFRYDAGGNIYVYDVDTGALRTLDCDSHAVGQVLLDTAFLEGVYPGSGPYDFFLCTETLRGVNLTDGTITEFLTLSDYDLSSMVNSVIYLSEDAFILGLNSVFSSDAQYQVLQRVSPEEIPEKTVITLAYGMGKEMMADGFTWKNTSGSLDLEIAEFNMRSSQYTIEVVEFADVNDLNLQMSAGEIPDIICWSNNLNDATAIKSYQRNGYLSDLLPFMTSDPEVDPDDLLPSIRDAYTESDGCIYMLPTELSCQSLLAHSQFVGTEPGWSFSDLYAVAQNLPEETVLINWTGSWLLKMLLQYTLDNFVDIETGTCSLDSEEFRSLMYTARDCLSTEDPYEITPDSFYTVEGLVSGEVLLQMGYWMGGASYASGTLPEYEAAGVTVIGYPGVGGNGAIIVPGVTFSICSVSDCPEGAWAFLRNYFTYDYQYSFGGFSKFPVMESALLDAEEEQRHISYDCTDEQFEAGINTVLNAVVPTLMDNTILNIILEEADPFLTGEKSFEDVISLMESRITIYLAEQS